MFHDILNRGVKRSLGPSMTSYPTFLPRSQEALLLCGYGGLAKGRFNATVTFRFSGKTYASWASNNVDSELRRLELI